MKETIISCIPNSVRRRRSSPVSQTVYAGDDHLLSPNSVRRRREYPKLSLCVRICLLGCLKIRNWHFIYYNWGIARPFFTIMCNHPFTKIRGLWKEPWTISSERQQRKTVRGTFYFANIHLSLMVLGSLLVAVLYQNFPLTKTKTQKRSLCRKNVKPWAVFGFIYQFLSRQAKKGFICGCLLVASLFS